MNIHFVDIENCADILANHANTLLTQDAPGGLTLHVIEYAGGDALLLQESITGGGVVIESLDAEYGGSIHEHLRRAAAAARR